MTAADDAAAVASAPESTSVALVAGVATAVTHVTASLTQLAAVAVLAAQASSAVKHDSMPAASMVPSFLQLPPPCLPPSEEVEPPSAVVVSVLAVVPDATHITRSARQVVAPERTQLTYVVAQSVAAVASTVPDSADCVEPTVLAPGELHPLKNALFDHPGSSRAQA
jgi:hypothetical protein